MLFIAFHGGPRSGQKVARTHTLEGIVDKDTCNSCRLCVGQEWAGALTPVLHKCTLHTSMCTHKENIGRDTRNTSPSGP